MIHFSSDTSAAREVDRETLQIVAAGQRVRISIGQVPTSLFLPPDAPLRERTLNRYSEISAGSSRGLSNFFKQAGQPRQLEVEMQWR